MSHIALIAKLAEETAKVLLRTKKNEINARESEVAQLKKKVKAAKSDAVRSGRLAEKAETEAPLAMGDKEKLLSKLIYCRGICQEKTKVVKEQVLLLNQLSAEKLQLEQKIKKLVDQKKSSKCYRRQQKSKVQQEAKAHNSLPLASAVSDEAMDPNASDAGMALDKTPRQGMDFEEAVDVVVEQLIKQSGKKQYSRRVREVVQELLVKRVSQNSVSGVIDTVVASAAAILSESGSQTGHGGTGSNGVVMPFQSGVKLELSRTFIQRCAGELAVKQFAFVSFIVQQYLENDSWHLSLHCDGTTDASGQDIMSAVLHVSPRNPDGGSGDVSRKISMGRIMCHGKGSEIETRVVCERMVDIKRFSMNDNDKSILPSVTGFVSDDADPAVAGSARLRAKQREVRLEEGLPPAKSRQSSCATHFLCNLQSKVSDGMSDMLTPSARSESDDGVDTNGDGDDDDSDPTVPELDDVAHASTKSPNIISAMRTLHKCYLMKGHRAGSNKEFLEWLVEKYGASDHVKIANSQQRLVGARFLSFSRASMIEYYLYETFKEYMWVFLSSQTKTDVNKLVLATADILMINEVKVLLRTQAILHLDIFSPMFYEIVFLENQKDVGDMIRAIDGLVDAIVSDPDGLAGRIDSGEPLIDYNFSFKDKMKVSESKAEIVEICEKQLRLDDVEAPNDALVVVVVYVLYYVQQGLKHYFREYLADDGLLNPGNPALTPEDKESMHVTLAHNHINEQDLSRVKVQQERSSRTAKTSTLNAVNMAISNGHLSGLAEVSAAQRETFNKNAQDKWKLMFEMDTRDKARSIQAGRARAIAQMKKSDKAAAANSSIAVKAGDTFKSQQAFSLAYAAATVTDTSCNPPVESDRRKLLKIGCQWFNRLTKLSYFKDGANRQFTKMFEKGPTGRRKRMAQSVSGEPIPLHVQHENVGELVTELEQGSVPPSRCDLDDRDNALPLERGLSFDTIRSIDVAAAIAGSSVFKKTQEGYTKNEKNKESIKAKDYSS